MVSVTEVTYIGGIPVLGLVALSTDVLPTRPTLVQGFELTNGSTVIIRDKSAQTTTAKFFDEENNEWENL